MMHGCKHTTGFTGILLFILGIVFLIADVTTWNFWGIHWWSVLFIVFGFGLLISGNCTECKQKK